jgi:hypothetical protein
MTSYNLKVFLMKLFNTIQSTVRENFFYLALIISIVLVCSVDYRAPFQELFISVNYWKGEVPYADDIFIESLESFNLRFYFIYIIYFLENLTFFNLEEILIILNRIIHISLFFSLFLICKDIFRSSAIGITPFLLITTFGLLGFNFANFNLYNFNLDSQHFFYLFFFIGSYFFLKGKELYFVVFIALGSLIHFLLAIFYFGSFMLYKLLLRSSYKELITFSLIFILLSLPIVAPYILSQSISIFTSQEFITLYVYERHPHHYLLSSFFISDLLYLIFSVAGAIIIYKSDIFKFSIIKYLLLCYLIALTLLPFHFIFVELIPVKYFGILGATRFFSHISMMIIVFALSLLLRIIVRSHYFLKIKIPLNFLAMFILINSLIYDFNSRNFSKLDYLRYEILTLERPDAYKEFIALNDACSWVKKNTSFNIKVVSNFSDIRWSCNRALIGGGTYPFTSNELIIQKFFNERAYSNQLLSDFSMATDDIFSEKVVYIVNNNFKSEYLEKIYSNDLINVYIKKITR